MRGCAMLSMEIWTWFLEEMDPDGVGSTQQRLTSKRGAETHHHFNQDLCWHPADSRLVTTGPLVTFDLDVTDRNFEYLI